MPARQPVSPYRVQVLDRALGILDFLSHQESEMALMELSERVGLHKSTVHRLLRVLERHRLIEQDGQTGKYRLGLRLFELGSRSVARLDVAERARPALKQLVFETGETAHVCILDRGEVLSLAYEESPRTIRTPSTVGHRNPAYCTASGKALLAFLLEEELDHIIGNKGLRSYTRNTITAAAELRTELGRIRKRGWALDNEEIEENLKCIAAPVKNYTRAVVASISIAGPAFRMTHAEIPVLAEAILRASVRLSTALGYSEEESKVETARGLASAPRKRA